HLQQAQGGFPQHSRSPRRSPFPPSSRSPRRFRSLKFQPFQRILRRRPFPSSPPWPAVHRGLSISLSFSYFISIIVSLHHHLTRVYTHPRCLFPFCHAYRLLLGPSCI